MEAVLCLAELGHFIQNPSLFPPLHAPHHHASWTLIDVPCVSQPSTYHLPLTIKKFNPMVLQTMLCSRKILMYQDSLLFKIK